MEALTVLYVNDVNPENIREVSCRMSSLERHAIGEVLWDKPSLAPKVSFSIAYSDNCIFLKYFVKEHAIRVTHTFDNSPVYQDSCVEFFISFDEAKPYYNLEFNSIGTCTFEFGNGKSDRLLMEQKHIDKIGRHSIIESSVYNGSPVIHWELSVVIPFDVFVFHCIASLADVRCKANFYKCGDALPAPHFLSWQKIISDIPNFHLPDFFGDLHFAKP